MTDAPRIPQEPRSFENASPPQASEMGGGDHAIDFASDQNPGEGDVTSQRGHNFGTLKQTSLNQWAVNDR